MDRSWEWLGYTIEDVLPGTYDVSFSISAPNAGGIFYAQLSGQNLGVIDVPSTGGWYNWEDIPSQRIEITEGRNSLKFKSFRLVSIYKVLLLTRS